MFYRRHASVVGITTEPSPLITRISNWRRPNSYGRQAPETAVLVPHQPQKPVETFSVFADKIDRHCHPSQLPSQILQTKIT
jgi:hypothetical protein